MFRITRHRSNAFRNPAGGGGDYTLGLLDSFESIGTDGSGFAAPTSGAQNLVWARAGGASGLYSRTTDEVTEGSFNGELTGGANGVGIYTPSFADYSNVTTFSLDYRCSTDVSLTYIHLIIQDGDSNIDDVFGTDVTSGTINFTPVGVDMSNAIIAISGGDVGELGGWTIWFDNLRIS